MPRIQIASGFEPNTTSTESSASSTTPSITLTNSKNHILNVHAVTPSIIRVVHSLPSSKYHQKFQKGVNWEEGLKDVEVIYNEEDNSLILDTGILKVKVNYGEIGKSPRLEWFDSLKSSNSKNSGVAFLSDSKTRAYSFDATSGQVIHFVERENHLPVSEDEDTINIDGSPFLHDERNEFIYGLGESRGTMEKTGKKFTMEGRDALGYDWEHGDPLYKVNPFYIVYNKSTEKYYGIFYNNLTDSSFDMGSESDVLFGCFRKYTANCGPLDYYVLRGDGTLPSILTSYASLLSPTSLDSHPIAASPTLPPLSQFGYLSSSLSLAADPKAQEAIIEFLITCRKENFPVDGLYLSSGWCEDEVTLDRNYFVWNKLRYPSPLTFGTIVEKELGVQIIVNMKPWLLSTHPLRTSALNSDSFIKAAIGEEEEDQETLPRHWVWSKGFAAHAQGNYFDYSGTKGSSWWKEQIQKQVMENECTGMWIDNNEMAGMVDDEEMYRGEIGIWNAIGVADNVEKRMGWGGGMMRVGGVGKAVNTMGMARATYEAVLSKRPSIRPVIVSRSGVPGIQAYAHATWSGDNSTTWKALKWGTKMTLSVGLSFGPGLYGHDIGGFAGINHPSPELLVRWCQNGAWHSRFTVHSWKEVSTTLFMYNSIPGITKILQNVLAFRYRLAPTFYSLYITHYQRRGWPILKPIMWYHSKDPKTLKLDEEFIFGSHVLVASVTTKGDLTRSIYLPNKSNDGENNLMWCELDTGIWIEGKGEIVVLDAPLARTPVLVRAGGILILGGKCTRNIYDGTSIREVLIFPSPSLSIPTSTSSLNSTDLVERSGTKGTFTLIEDDGITNEHTLLGIYTELIISFQIVSFTSSTSNSSAKVEEKIQINYEIIKKDYNLPYTELEFILPKGDKRELITVEGKELIHFGESRWGLRI